MALFRSIVESVNERLLFGKVLALGTLLEAKVGISVCDCLIKVCGKVVPLVGGGRDECCR